MILKLKDIYQALIDGKRIKNVTWRATAYNYLNSDGNLVDDTGRRVYEPFVDEKQWSIYEEP